MDNKSNMEKLDKVSISQKIGHVLWKIVIVIAALLFIIPMIPFVIIGFFVDVLASASRDELS